MIDRILLVDDDEDDRELFCDAITEVDSTLICYCAESGALALRDLDNGNFAGVKLIVLDVNMPMNSGWDVLKNLKEHPIHRVIPVLMYSTSTSPANLSRSETLGAAGFITKPSDFTSLKDLIRIIVSTPKQLTHTIADAYNRTRSG